MCVRLLLYLDAMNSIRDGNSNYRNYAHTSLIVGIRSLQCILLKVALLLGVKFHNGLEFLEIEEPDSQIGWHAKLNPSDHPLNLFEFDILVGADGARKSRVPGFDRKELRGKLALAITANFRNKFTREEAAVQEISGVAFIFNQKFFKVCWIQLFSRFSSRNACISVYSSSQRLFQNVLKCLQLVIHNTSP